jgi:2-dehydropantoate 2-reductase
VPQGPVVVVGPGAMGCLLSAQIAASGRRVVLLDRSEPRAQQIAERGVLIGETAVPVEAVVSLANLGEPPAVAFLCVKARDTEAALKAIASLGEVTVAVLQNGLGRAAAVGELIGDPSRVVGVFTSEGATVVGPGAISRRGEGHTTVGPLVASGLARAQAVGRILAKGFSVSVEEDLRRLEWEKVQVNAAINALTGLLGCLNGALLESENGQALADLAAEEVGAVASAAGVPGEWSPEASRARWRAVAHATEGNRSSTLSDLWKGQKTEVFAINGAVAEVAANNGVNACVNRVLAQMIQAREELGTPPTPAS